MSPPRVVVAGVSGSGKSTVGRALARRLEVPFVDGDDLHPTANLAKMSAGRPLDDADRAPWLDAVGHRLLEQRDGVVVACSALRRAYRDRLRAHVPDLGLLLLDGDPALIESRQAGRADHFMPAGLLPSQLAALEPLGHDEVGLTLDVALEVDVIVATYLEHRADT